MIVCICMAARVSEVVHIAAPCDHQWTVRECVAASCSTLYILPHLLISVVQTSVGLMLPGECDTVWTSNRNAFVLNDNVNLHAIDATFFFEMSLIYI